MKRSNYKTIFHIPSLGGAWGGHIPSLGGAWGGHIPSFGGAWGGHIPSFGGAWGGHIPSFGGAWGGLLCLLLLSSCLKDQDDYFSESPSERLVNTMQHVKQLLCSAEYGWEFEYYPHSSLAYGGIVYTVKFDSLTATVACSLVPDSTYTSYYKMTNDNGPVLTFDTYNPLLHYFSTPSATEYEAKGGEFEFVIDSIADDQIVLYGKKTRNTMYLRRLTAPADNYTAKTIRIFDNFIERFTGTIGGIETEGKFTLSSKRLVVATPTDTITNCFTYTDYGIRFYRPMHIGNATVQTFAFDPETQQLTCLDKGYENITLQGIPFDEQTMALKDYTGNYALRYDGTKSARVSITVNRIDGSLILSGLSPMYNLQLTYDYDTGDLKLSPQVVGEYNGRTVYFVSYGSDGGHVWLADDASFTIKWNKNKYYPAFNFQATNPQLYNCDSALLVMVYTNEEGQLTAAVMDDGAWLTNNSPLIQNIRSLTKLRN